MKKIKILIKRLLTFVYHPIIFFTLGWNNNLIVGKKIRINTLKYLKIGRNVTINSDARFLFIKNYAGGGYNPKVIIGNNVFVAYHLTIMAAAPVIIEDNVLIASDVLITSENHGVDPEYSQSYSQTPLDGKPVKICNGTWIGEKAIILPGVTIGQRSIVAAGAVVTKSYPAYSMIAGVPAKIIKYYDLTAHKWIKVE